MKKTIDLCNENSRGKEEPMERKKLEKKVDVRKVIVCVVMAIVVAIAGLVMYSENVQKIGFIEDIKQAIEDMINPNADTTGTSEATVIDVTGIEPGDVGNHTCSEYYVSKYDETYHWNECKICGKVYDKVAHNIIDNGWTMGSANNCHENNIHKFSCNCGYSYTNTNGRSGHSYDGRLNDTSRYVVVRYCQKCNHRENIEECQKSDGSRISKNNLGVCRWCGFNYNSHIHNFWRPFKLNEDNSFSIADAQPDWDIYSRFEENNAYCRYCNEYMFHLEDAHLERISDTVCKCYVTITVPDGSSFLETFEPGWSGGTSSVEEKIDGNRWTGVCTININSHIEDPDFNAGLFQFVGNLNGEKSGYNFCFKGIMPDKEAPVVTTVNQDESAQWEKTKEIVITGTENYCSSVKVEILDGEEVIYEGTASVTNNNWSITAVPEIEADEIGKQFTVRVTDPLKNSGTQEFTVKKVDSIAPEVTESEIIIGGDWAREKSYTFGATDGGVGNVSIAFNDLGDYSTASVDGTTYAREYKLVGDVYEPRQAVIYYKDELGNTSTQTITIDKLDNTKPTIVDAILDGKTVTINAHDRHETEGEGSGIVKYRYMLSRKQLDNLEMTENNSKEVDVADSFVIEDLLPYYYVYIVAIDTAGNVSDVYTIGWESESDVTTVDATGVVAGDIGNHACSEYYVSKYDETYHWNECKICGKEYDKVAHSFADNGWTMGSANNCHPNNIHKFSCNCGYSYANTNGKLACNDFTTWHVDTGCKVIECNRCYSNYRLDHRCITSNGKYIGCDNLGTCTICGHLWRTGEIYHKFTLDGNIGESFKCLNCNQTIKLLQKEIISVDKENNTIKFKLTALLPYGSVDTTWPCIISGIGANSSVTHTTYSTNEEGGTAITYEVTMKCNGRQYTKRRSYCMLLC